MSSQRTHALRCDTIGCPSVFVPRAPWPEEEYPSHLGSVREAAKLHGWVSKFNPAERAGTGAWMEDFCAHCACRMKNNERFVEGETA